MVVMVMVMVIWKRLWNIYWLNYILFISSTIKKIISMDHSFLIIIENDY